MPQIGEVKKGKEIGYRGINHKWIWYACEICGKQRWVTMLRGKPQWKICSECSLRRPSLVGANHNAWKGGRYQNKDGYIEVWLNPSDFFYPMANSHHYVLEHRLVMAKKLGRCLASWELVHHEGIRYIGIENKSDNLEDNLELTTNGSHSVEHQKGYRDGYQKGLKDGFDKGYLDGKNKTHEEKD